MSACSPHVVLYSIVRSELSRSDTAVASCCAQLDVRAHQCYLRTIRSICYRTSSGVPVRELLGIGFVRFGVHWLAIGSGALRQIHHSCARHCASSTFLSPYSAVRYLRTPMLHSPPYLLIANTRWTLILPKMCPWSFISHTHL
jgi:hypothetical protein